MAFGSISLRQSPSAFSSLGPGLRAVALVSPEENRVPEQKCNGNGNIVPWSALQKCSNSGIPRNTIRCVMALAHAYFMCIQVYSAMRIHCVCIFYVYTGIQMYTHTSIERQLTLYVYIYIYICMLTIYIYTHTHIHVCFSVWLSVCHCVCICLCLWGASWVSPPGSELARSFVGVALRGCTRDATRFQARVA